MNFYFILFFFFFFDKNINVFISKFCKFMQNFCIKSTANKNATTTTTKQQQQQINKQTNERTKQQNKRNKYNKIVSKSVINNMNNYWQQAKNF